MKKYIIIFSAAIFAAMGFVSCNFGTSFKEVTNIKLNKESLVMNVGEEFVLEATVTPDNATVKGVVWSSSNPNVVIVANGVVTAYRAGTAYVFAQAGDETATCKVDVSGDSPGDSYVEVTNIKLNKDSLVLNIGKEFVLQATVMPDNATVKGITWSSSNPNVAIVTNNGIVTAYSFGTAYIYAQAGNKTAVCKVVINSLNGTVWRSVYYTDWYMSFFEDTVLWDMGGDAVTFTYTYNYPDFCLYADGEAAYYGFVSGRQLTIGYYVFLLQ